MKKISSICLMLALLVLLQCFPVPVYAEEADETEAVSTVPETSEETGPVVQETAPEADFGTATVANGCRSIEAQVPLGGAERRLKTSQAAFVYERNTDTVLHAYNPDVNISPGALTMIMTAIVAIEESQNLDKQVTISTRNYKTLPVGARNQKLKEGEVMTLRDLLYCMVLVSANDAAISIAEHIAGSEAAFVTLMNQYAEKIGCRSTVFANCHGQNHANQHTTARDLVRITEYAIRNPIFKELFAATSYTVPETNKSEERKLKSTNYLIEETIVPKFNDKRCTGGKEHYSDSTGAHIVATGEDKGMSLICVVLGGERKFKENGYTVEYYGNFEEVMELLDFGFGDYKLCRLLHDGQSLTQFPVAGGENQVVAQSHASVDAVLPTDAKLNKLILKYNVLNGGLTAPLKMDQLIGTLQIWYRTSCIAETELYSMSSVRAAEDSDLKVRGVASRDDTNIKSILSFIGVVCLVLFIPIVLYLFYNNLRRAIARKKRRDRRKSRRRSR